MKQTLTRYHTVAYLFFLTVISACQPVGIQPVSTSSTISTPAQTPTLSPSIAAPTRTMSPEQAMVIPGSGTGTESSAPTAAQPIPPTSIPETWKTFTNPALNVTLRYPENWQAQTATRVSGPNGFFELSIREYPASKFDRLVNLCVLDANNPDLTSIYGSFPFISDWQGWDVQRQDWIGHGCVVSPSGAAGSQAVLYARDPRSEAHNQLLELRADTAHFGGILSSLRFIEVGVPSTSTGYYDSPFCKEAPKAAPVTTQQIGELLIREYAIANATCDPWKHFDGFQARVKTLAIDQSAAQNRGTESRVESANRALAPFDYRLVVRPTSPQSFDLFKKAGLVIGGFTYFSPVSVNAAGDDFILWVQDSFNSSAPSEVRRGSVRTLKVGEEGFNSIWAGADLITFGYSRDRLFPIGAPAGVDISSNGQLIQTISIPQMGPSGTPVRQMWGWQGHWFVEIAGVLIQDGQLQNLKLGFEEIFNWHLVNDKPFFLMRQEKALSAKASGLYGMVYDGQVVPAFYDDIIHGDLCCDPAVYSILSFSSGVQFYALKDGVWFLVSVQTAQ
jgi:hypothetical protein